MDDWVQNPSSHTALDEILPCMDAETTNTSLYDEILPFMDAVTTNTSLYQNKEVASSLVKVVNQVITNVLNGNYPPFAAPPYFNQSGPLVPVLCNPYNADLTDWTCSTGELHFSNASKVSKHTFPYQTLVSNSPMFYSVLAFSCFHEMNIWLRDHIYKVDQNLNPNHNVNAGRAVTI